jgi:large subunit ribosomal protein L24
MSAVRIKKGDTVKVIAGKDKGATGKVKSVNASKHTAVVEGVNMMTKSAKPSQANPNGGIIHQEAPIDISNLMYFADDKVSRIGYQFQDGKKVRVAKATGKVID